MSSQPNPSPAMAEAETSGSMPAAETFTAEYVASLKAELAAKAESEAALKSKFASYEARQRTQLTEMQPAVRAWISEGLESGSEFRHEMESMVSFGDNLHQVANLESAVPLARMISCHSAKIKREREEFAQHTTAAEALGKANAELDSVKADRDAKAMRITELETLVVERTSAAEKLQDELSKAGLVQQKFDFSKATSREAAPPGASAPAAKSGASAPFVDPLLAFVSKAGAGSSRIGLSASGHHLLGANGAGDQGIEAALRSALA